MSSSSLIDNDIRKSKRTMSGDGGNVPANDKASTTRNNSIKKTKTTIENNNYQLATERVFILGAALLAVGTLGFYYIPGMVVLPEVEDEKRARHHLIDSFYCATMTLTTVGFGDICPGQTNFVGKVFLVIFTLSGLGIFCGPILDLASAWRFQIPGGLLTLASVTLGVGILVFSHIEGLPQSDAVYASIITGTTIGYGDFAPSTNVGKVAVALYAIASINVMAAFLEPAKTFLEKFCHAKVKVD